MVTFKKHTQEINKIASEFNLQDEMFDCEILSPDVQRDLDRKQLRNILKETSLAKHSSSEDSFTLFVNDIKFDEIQKEAMAVVEDLQMVKLEDQSSTSSQPMTSTHQSEHDIIGHSINLTSQHLSSTTSAESKPHDSDLKMFIEDSEKHIKEFENFNNDNIHSKTSDMRIDVKKLTKRLENVRKANVLDSKNGPDLLFKVPSDEKENVRKTPLRVTRSGRASMDMKAIEKSRNNNKGSHNLHHSNENAQPSTVLQSTDLDGNKLQRNKYGGSLRIGRSGLRSAGDCNSIESSKIDRAEIGNKLERNKFGGSLRLNRRPSVSSQSDTNVKSKANSKNDANLSGAVHRNGSSASGSSSKSVGNVSERSSVSSTEFSRKPVIKQSLGHSSVRRTTSDNKNTSHSMSFNSSFHQRAKHSDAYSSVTSAVSKKPILKQNLQNVPSAPTSTNFIGRRTSSISSNSISEKPKPLKATSKFCLGGKDNFQKQTTSSGSEISDDVFSQSFNNSIRHGQSFMTPKHTRLAGGPLSGSLHDSIIFESPFSTSGMVASSTPASVMRRASLRSAQLPTPFRRTSTCNKKSSTSFIGK